MAQTLSTAQDLVGEMSFATNNELLNTSNPAGMGSNSNNQFVQGKPNDPISKIYSRAGLNFSAGFKLEAKDFNDKWYSAKVVETDWIEREVLIHFEKWSSRYDEWIPMDSSRLRVPATTRETKLKKFTVGERILATWVDGKKYPARVNELLENDKYDVLFDDGYSKILKTSKMTKLFEVVDSKVKETYVGSKQERRDKKRKHNVTELFTHHAKKKMRNDNEKYKKQDFNDPHKVKYGNNWESDLKKSKPDLGVNLYQHEGKAGPNSAVDEDHTTFIGNLRVEIEDSSYKCPKSGCNKNFRKENLLQMHMKHYHPEYSKFLGSTPNVADLAYARTVGESFEDLIPKKMRIPIPQTVQEQALSTSHMNDTNFVQNVDNKLYAEHDNNAPEDYLTEQSNNCPMSPGRLFDMRSKEEKTHTGIKTLRPVRQLTVVEAEDNKQLHCSNISNDNHKIILFDKGKINRKREAYSESLGKINKPQGLSENEEIYDDCNDSFLDGDDFSDYRCNNSTVLSETDNNDSIQNKNENIILVNGELIKVEKLRKEEIINCTCSITEEDGLMIQCDLCLCWQHGHCNAIEKEKDVPEKYICCICHNSFRQRPSKKYFQDQDWIREGILPSIRKCPSDVFESNKRTAMLKRTYDLVAGQLEIQNLLHSLRVKVNIAQKKDHPKLYLWATNWSKIEIPALKMEPVPIMEIIKTENSYNKYFDENMKDVLEFPFSAKLDPNQKLITSDTELMKILEEDNLQTEEPKSPIKYSATNNSKDDGQILLNKLTKNGFKEQDQQVPLMKSGMGYRNSPTRVNSVSKASEKSNKTQVMNKFLDISQPVIPVPEAPIDPIECKLRLLEHISHFQNYVDSVLNFVETQLSALEDMNVSSNKHIRSKQTIQMLLNDLETIRKLPALC